MSFAFGHLVGAWLFGKAYEKIAKKKISSWSWFFILFGSILPDADFLLDWTLGTELHRTFTHSIIFLFIAPIILYLLTFKRTDKHILSLALGAGILSHLLLDMLSAPGVPLFWPSYLHFRYTSIQWIDPASVGLFMGGLEAFKTRLQRAIVDMAIGTAWIFYLTIRKRIQF